MPQTITFANGETFRKPRGWKSLDHVKGYDSDGNLFAVEVYPNGYAQAWGLTWCCGASFKGMEDYVGCRSCYKPAAGSDLVFGPVVWVEGFEPPADLKIY